MFFIKFQEYFEKMYLCSGALRWVFIKWEQNNIANSIFLNNYSIYVMRYAIWYHLYNFKKREKHLWMSVNFSKVAGLKPATLLKLALLHGCFSRFLNCANGTKSHNASHILMSWFIPFESTKNTKAQKDTKLVFQKKL